MGAEVMQVAVMWEVDMATEATAVTAMADTDTVVTGMDTVATGTEPATTEPGLTMEWVTVALATAVSAMAATIPATLQPIPATDRRSLPLAEYCIVADGRVAVTDPWPVARLSKSGCPIALRDGVASSKMLLDSASDLSLGSRHAICLPVFVDGDNKSVPHASLTNAVSMTLDVVEKRPVVLTSLVQSASARRARWRPRVVRRLPMTLDRRKSGVS
jgi:hypothetical protein